MRRMHFAVFLVAANVLRSPVAARVLAEQRRGVRVRGEVAAADMPRLVVSVDATALREKYITSL